MAYIIFQSNHDEISNLDSYKFDSGFWVKNQGNQLGIDFNVHMNTFEHQKTDSECGMYCLYFTIQMLKDKDITYFLENEIPDKEVFDLRNKYFNAD